MHPIFQEETTSKTVISGMKTAGNKGIKFWMNTNFLPVHDSSFTNSSLWYRIK